MPVPGLFDAITPTEAGDELAAPLRQSLYGAQQSSPDEQAKVIKLSDRTGIPPAVVQRNKPEVERLHADLFDFQGYAKDNPKTAGWIAANPDLAPVVKDDLDNLSGVERVMRYGSDFVRALVASAPASIGGLMALPTAAVEITDPSLAKGRQIDIGDPEIGASVRRFVTGWLQRSRAAAESDAAKIRGDQSGYGFVGKSVLQGAESLGQMALLTPVSILTGSPAPMLAGMGAITGGQSYNKARDKGLDPMAALAYGGTDAAIEVATEFIPAKWLLRDLALKHGLLKTVGRQLVSENVGEQAATALQDLNEWATLNPDKPFSSYLAERPSAAAATLIGTMVAVGGHVMVARAVDHAVNGKPTEQRFVEALGEAVDNSKTFHRLPPALRALVEEHTKDGPLTHLYEPVAHWQEYWQSKDADPREVARELLGDVTAYDQAVNTGEDIKIPLGAYAERIAPTEHNAAFAQELRFAPDEMNAREQIDWVKQQDAAEKQNAANNQGSAQQVADQSSEFVREAMFEKLKAAGFTDSAAQAQSILYQARYRQRAALLGEDPLTVFQRQGEAGQGPAVNRVMPSAALDKIGNVSELDALIDRLRSGEVPVKTDDPLHDLGKVLHESGIDLNQVDNEAVKSMLQGGQQQAQPSGPQTTLEQSAPPSATAKRLRKNLTPDEQSKLTNSMADKIAERLTTLPAAEEMAAVAHAGRAKRGWYRESAAAIATVFGGDAPRFTALLAAMSPQTSVETNLKNALNTWKNWLAAGRPTDREQILDIMAASVEGGGTRKSVLDAWVNNTVRALATDAPVLSGPKVNSFLRNLMGHVEEVTNDAWMANYALVDQKMFAGVLNKAGTDPGKGSGYLAMNIRVREAAKILTRLSGETWTPAEVQETVWSWAKALYELRDAAGEERTTQELLADKALTDSLINATPDFGTLFYNDNVATILREAGYGTEVDKLIGAAVGANAANQVAGTKGEAGPFTADTQRRHERRAARRLEDLRDQRAIERAAGLQPGGLGGIPGLPEAQAAAESAAQGIQKLEGFPDAPLKIAEQWYVPGPLAAAHRVSQAYGAMQSAISGQPYQPPKRFLKVDRARAARIAAEFDAMKHDPANPEVKAAYDAMVIETLAQWQVIKSTGLKIEFIKEGQADPYGVSPRQAIMDVRDNNHLWVFPTSGGFGSSDADVRGNPLLAMTDEVVDGKRLQANDVFRIVHDYFGHIKDGNGFRADGEENAWRSHSAMYSPLARRAMTTETRGQNSWVNFGPYGEQNRTASGGDTKYADQKIGLLPDWVIEEGRGDETVLEQAVDQTNTPEFKRWFGDSKVVDAQGKPLVVYHGTEQDFDTFLPSKRPKEPGIFFAVHPAIASAYAGHDPQGNFHAPDMGSVLPVYLKIENPLVVDFMGGKTGRTEAFKRAIEGGHDGVLLKNHYDAGGVQDQWAVFRPEQIKSAIGNSGAFDPNDQNILAQKTGEKQPRGRIRFGADRHFNIDLLKDANLSTFLHESGHMWLEEMRDDIAYVSGLEAPTENQYKLLDDGAALLKWLGAPSWDAITTDQHEQFARGFEAYLREGKAPSHELRSAFNTFKAWLKAIYQSLRGLNVTLSDDVRGVMDRMLASEEAIDAAMNEAQVTPIFATAEDAKMTPEEFKAYRTALEDINLTARERLQAKLMAEYQREHEKQWKDNAEVVRAEVLAELNVDPQYLALSALTRGKMPDGKPLPADTPKDKLSKDDLIARRGKEFLKRMPRVYQVEGGLSPDAAAEIYGFKSGDDLIDSMANALKLGQKVEAEVDKRMRARYGDMRLNGEIAKEALKEVHSDARGEILRKELKALRKRVADARPAVQLERDKQAAARRAGVAVIRAVPGTEPVAGTRKGVPIIRNVPSQAYKLRAQGMISQMAVRDIKPNNYLIAERKAGTRAIEAAAKGDYVTAAALKEKQLLNYELFKEAQRATDRIESMFAYQSKFDRRSVRERIGKSGNDYLDQIDKIRERFQFKRVPLQTIDYRKSLASWHQSMIDQGFEPAMSDEERGVLNEAFRVNYKDMTFDELEGVRAALESIEHLSKRATQIRGATALALFEDSVDTLVDHARANKVKAPAEKHRIAKRFADRVKDKLTGWDTSLIPIETLTEMLDGGAVGPWHDYIFNRASASQSTEYDMDGKIADKLNKLIEGYVNGNIRRARDVIKTSLRTTPMTRHELISIAFNAGNESNLDKMLRGHGWTRDQVMLELQNLDAADLEFVQKVWDTIGELFPALSALQQLVSGLPLAKIEPAPFSITTKGGDVVDLRGGYFPVKYDRQLSNVGVKQDTGPIAGLTEHGSGRATIPDSFRKGRTAFAAPLLLDYELILQRHVAGVIKDLSHREFLIDANKLLNNQRIRNVLTERLGSDYEAMFMPWLRGVANDGAATNEPLDGMDKFWEGARSNLTVVALGFKASTILAQIGGVPNSIEYISQHYGTMFFAKALARATAAPFETTRFVITKSGEMKHRFATRDRDTRDELRKISQSGVSKIRRWTERAAFAGINYADRMVSVPTWLAAYNGSISQGAEEAQAIHAGDAAVRRSQGAGGAKDLSQAQRKRGLNKVITMFYTPFAAQYGRIRAVGAAGSARGLKYAPEAVMRVAMITMLPAIISDLVTGRGPKDCAIDDAACWAKWAGIKSIFSVSATVPVVRDMGNSLENYLNGKRGTDPRFSPVIDMMTKVFKGVLHTGEATLGDRVFDSKLFFDNIETSGYLFGLPTAQPRITLEYLYDLMEGNVDVDNVGTFMHDLLFRRDKTP